MRLLNRNCKLIRYKLYEGKEEVIDEDGYNTGEFILRFSNFKSIKASVSTSKGDLSLELFGVNNDYDRVIVVSDISCPIDEYTLVYIDGMEYEVKRVSPSINYIAYGVKRVMKNENYRS